MYKTARIDGTARDVHASHGRHTRSHDRRRGRTVDWQNLAVYALISVVLAVSAFMPAWLGRY
jgi:hypothetical protein